jgi:hypothetical protein
MQMRVLFIMAHDYTLLQDMSFWPKETNASMRRIGRGEVGEIFEGFC